MNKFISAVIVFAAAGMACAGELENSAVSADLNSVSLSQYKSIDVPTPVMEKAAAVSAAFKNAVKKEYEKLSGYNDLNNGNYTIDQLPIAKVSELPPAAQKQLKKDNAQWGPDYLSVPYKMPVQGKTVYVIQNENDGGMFVTIFDANGSLVAEGACSESGEFGWSGEKAVMTKKAAAGKTSLAAIKSGYAEKGISGVGPHTLLPNGAYSLLPDEVKGVIAKYNKKCLGMNIGAQIDMRIYKLSKDGSGGYLVQCKFDEYTFASLFDADGKLLADGSADSSEFGWNN
jgi:hypothetical protein